MMKQKNHFMLIRIMPKVLTKLKSVQKVLRIFLDLQITIICWQIIGIAEHFMLSEKCFGKNENKCEKKRK